MALPNVGEHWPFFWGPKENKKVEEDWIYSLSDWLIWNIGTPGSRASNAVWNLHHQPPSSQAFELHKLSWVSSLQMASHVTSQLPKSLEPIPYNKLLYIYVYICMYVYKYKYIFIFMYMFLNINTYIFSLFIYNIIIHIYFLYTHTHTYEESWLAPKCSIFSPIPYVKRCSLVALQALQKRK